MSMNLDEAQMLIIAARHGIDLTKVVTPPFELRMQELELCLARQGKMSPIQLQSKKPKRISM